MKIEIPSDVLRNVVVAIIIALVCSFVTYHYTAKHYQAKYDALNAEYTAFKAQYQAIVVEKENAIIAKAQADKAAKVPVVEYIKGDTVTEIQYVEKQSKNDADIEITNKAKPIIVSYNGQKEQLPTTTTEGKTIADGKTTITQETTATLDIDAIVNRQIANRIAEDDHKIAVLKRQKTQNLVWGIIGGAVIGRGTANGAVINF